MLIPLVDMVDMENLVTVISDLYDQFVAVLEQLLHIVCYVPAHRR